MKIERIKNTLRRLLAVIMSVLMMLGSLPVVAIAEGISDMLPEEKQSSPIQVDSDSFSLSENYDIMPLAAPVATGFVQPQTSRYSATGWADAYDAQTIFAGSTIFMRFRVKTTNSGDMGTMRVVIEQWIDGQKVNSDYEISSVNASGSDLTKSDQGGYTIEITKGNSFANLSVPGFTPEEGMTKAEFKVLIYGGNSQITSNTLTFNIKPASEKVDFDIQLYRAIAATDGSGTFSFNSSPDVNFTSGSVVKFRISVQNLSAAGKDITLNLSMAGITPAFTYVIDEDLTDTSQPGYGRITYSNGRLFLPEGITVVLKPTSDNRTFSDNFTYTVTATYADDNKFSDSKTLNGYTTTGGSNNFGYNLALAGTYFPGMTGGEFQGKTASEDVRHTIGGIVMKENGWSAGGAQKFLHVEQYAEGAAIPVVGVRPVDPSGNAFLFWYDKRALTEKDRFLSPGDTVYKDNTSDHSIDAIWAYISTEGATEIHNGNGFSIDVTQPTLALVGENNEYSTDTVLSKIKTVYSFKLEVYNSNGTKVEKYTSGSYDSVEAMIAAEAANWEQENIGHYVYTVIASVSMRDGSGEIIAEATSTADLEILPRPVVVEANSNKYPYNGTAYTVAGSTGKPYAVWDTASKYFDGGSLKSDIEAILEKVYKDVTGESLPDKPYTQGDVYLADGNWGNRDSLVSVTYGNNAPTQTYPGKYTAYIDMKTEGDLAGASKYQYSENGKEYTVYIKGNYAYILIDGAMEIVPAELEFEKILDDDVTSAEFTFEVYQGNELAYFKKTDDGYLQVPSTEPGAVSSFTFKYPGGPMSLSVLFVYTDNDEGLEYTVKEVSAKRNGADVAEGYYDTSYDWSGTNGSGNTGKIPMEKKAKVTVTNSTDPDITVSKTVDTDSDDYWDDDRYTKGENIPWIITVTNSGKRPLYDVVLTDELAGVVIDSVTSNDPSHSINGPYSSPLALGTMAVGEVITINVHYEVTDGDVAAGSVTNTANATGKDNRPTPTTVEDEDDDEQDTFTSGIDVEKAADTGSGNYKANGYKEGETMPWVITVTNTGTVPLHDVDLTDALSIAGESVTIVSMESNKRTFTAPYSFEQITEMAVDEVITIKVTNVVTEADVDAGSVTNNVSVEGKDPHDYPVRDTGTATQLTIDPSITLTKVLAQGCKPTLDEGFQVGETIRWTITVTNTGNVKLHDVVLTDGLTGVTVEEVSSTVTSHSIVKANPVIIGEMEPGEIITVTVSYVVKDTDVTATRVVNPADVTAKDPNEKELKEEDENEQPVVYPGIEIVKELNGTAPEDGDGYKLGEKITWKITVTNTGKVTLHNVKVTDPLTGDTFEIGTLTHGVDGQPGQSVTVITKEYTVTEADVAAGKIINVATVSSDETEDKEDDDEEPTVKSSISVTKEADKSDSRNYKEHGYRKGYTMPWIITVTNTGDLELHDVVLTDELAGVTIISVSSSVDSRTFTGPFSNPLTIGNLAVGEVITIKVTNVVTEADVTAEKVINNVTVKGKDTHDDEVTDRDDATQPTIDPKIEVTKVRAANCAPASDDGFVAGETITWTITVKNTGNVTLTDVVVEDGLTGVEIGDVQLPAGHSIKAQSGSSLTIDKLEPEESATITVSYEVKPEDIDDEEVRNSVTATGKDPNQEEVDDDAENTQPLVYPDIEIVKVLADDMPKGPYKLGDKIHWKITVTNTGKMTLTNVVVTDEKTGDTWTIDSLAPGEDGQPGESRTFITGEYTVTQDDVDAGNVHNVATVKPDEIDEEKDDDDDEPTYQDPAIEIVKVLSDDMEDGPYELGDKITWKITVTNTGNVTLTDVEVTDPLTGDTFTVGKLEVADPNDPDKSGVSVTLTTAEYTVTQEDVDNGRVYNVATVTSNETDDEDDDDEEETKRDPAIEIVKVLSDNMEDGPYELGDKITWKITVTNTGNVTLTDVEVTDPLTGDTFTVGKLEVADPDDPDKPGVSVTLTTKEYTVTQEDVDNGRVYNVATVTSNETDDEDDDDEEETKRDPGIKIVKELSADIVVPEEGFAVGDKITWKITVTNTGNTTLTNVEVKDPLTGNKWIIDKLAPGVDGQPGESKTFTTAEYTVTQADVDNGRVYNVATVKSNETDEEKDDDEEPTVEHDPHLTLKKTTVSKPKNGRAYVLGETIKYEITVTHDGNVTVFDITITDPLTGDKWTVKKLAPGETSTVFEASYVVKAGDVTAKKVTNQATAKGYGPEDPDNPDERPEVPADPVEVTDPTTESPSSTTPKTGDDNNLRLWASLMPTSLLGIIIAAAAPRKKRSRASGKS